MPIDSAVDAMLSIAAVILPLWIVGFLIFKIITRKPSRKTRLPPEGFHTQRSKTVVLGRRAGRNRYGNSGISHRQDRDDVLSPYTEAEEDDRRSRAEERTSPYRAFDLYQAGSSATRDDACTPSRSSSDDGSGSRDSGCSSDSSGGGYSSTD
jgi:uncharacterized membrane protein YgcG